MHGVTDALTNSISASSSSGTALSMQQEFVRILEQVIWPIHEAAVYIIMFIGFCFIYKAMHNLKHHTSGHGMQQHHKPMGIVMLFAAGAMLLGFPQVMQAFSTSVFGYFVPNGLNPLEHMVMGGNYNYSNQILVYASNILQVTDTSQQIAYFTYGLLGLVGVLSFFYGIHGLIKVGEGSQGGQQSVLNKSLVHMGAGFIGMNAQLVMQVIDNMRQFF